MKNFKVGVQLYSVRDDMAKDIHKTLKAVKDAGYDYVELAGYYDTDPKEFKKLLDEYGLKAISTHDSYERLLNDPEGVLGELKEFGMEYFGIPGIWGIDRDRARGTEEYAKIIGDVKKTGELLEKEEIKLLYHNHSFEFKRIDGKFILEWLLDDVGEIVSPEIDVCWVHYAGYNPQEYIMNFKGRLPVLHMKDFACTKLPDGPVYTDEIADDEKYPDKEKVGFESRPVGYGIQDVAKILKAAEEIGTEYIIVEEESNSDISSLEMIKKSRDYLKRLGV